MRVLHVIGQLVPGGSEKMTLQVAAEMRRRGHDHRVAVLGEIDASFVNSLGAAEVPIHSVSLPARRSLTGPAAVRAVAQLLRAEPADIVQGHSWGSSVVAGAAGLAAGVSAVATLHRIYYPAVQRRVDRALQRLWATVIVDSPAVAGLLVREAGLAAGRISVIPNFVSPELVRRGAERRHGAGNGPLRILMAAHFSPVKGHRHALEAIAALESERPGRFEVDMLGDGPLLPEMRAFAQRLRVDGVVRFHGRRSDLPVWLSRSDAVMLPSAWEGFGMILAEAMAFATPPVAFDVGGAADVIVDGRTGLLVPNGSSAGLAVALGRLHGDPALRRRLGTAGRARVASLYTVDSVLPAYERAYRSCVAAGRRRGGRANRAD